MAIDDYKHDKGLKSFGGLSLLRISHCSLFKMSNCILNNERYLMMCTIADTTLAEAAVSTTNIQTRQGRTQKTGSDHTLAGFNTRLSTHCKNATKFLPKAFFIFKLSATFLCIFDFEGLNSSKNRLFYANK